MDISTENTDEISVIKYLAFFAFIYFSVIMVGDFLIIYFEIDRNIGLSLGLLMASGFVTGARFVTDNKRCPSKKEKQKLIWGSLLISIIVSVLAAVLMIYINAGFEGIKSLQGMLTIPGLYWITAIVMLILIYWGVLALSYGWGTRKFAETQKISGIKK